MSECLLTVEVRNGAWMVAMGPDPTQLPGVWLVLLSLSFKTFGCYFSVMFIMSPGRRKVHYTFPDETEMVEEYDVSSGELLGTLQSVLNL